MEMDRKEFMKMVSKSFKNLSKIKLLCTDKEIGAMREQADWYV